MHGYYVIWFLLPFGYLLFVIWGLIKRALKIRGDEAPNQHINQLLLCSALFALAIGIDHTSILSRILTGIFTDEKMANVPRWLLYPALLLLYATVHDKMFKTKELPKKLHVPRSEF